MTKDRNVIWSVAFNIVSFSLCIYLIIAGQMNARIVKWAAEVLKVTNIRAIGLSIMIIGLIGLLVQLYCYNKRCK